MALDISPDYSINKTATVVRVTDKTGIYNAETNLGGWGAPNTELATVALFAILARKDSAGDQFLICHTDIVYDPEAANTKETGFEFTYTQDGVHHIIIGNLPVSDDGVSYINGGGVIPSEDYFYYSEKAWLMTDDGAQEVTLASLIDNANVVQGVCKDIFLAKLAIEKQAQYKTYRVHRETNCDDAESLFREILKLSEDIKGATYAFYSNLEVEAQDQVESLLEKYQLTS